METRQTMNSQLYTAASGMIVERQRLDLIANNLANVSSPGYRAQRLFSVPFGRRDAGPLPGAPGSNLAVAAGGSYDVPRVGLPRETGRPLDVALDDGSFLTLQTTAGRRYVRGGSLRVSAAGELTDSLGNRVLDAKNKPITGLGSATTLTRDGRVVEKGAERGRLRVVRDPAEVLRRAGDNLWAAEGREASLESTDEPLVRPGWLEGSGTDALGELGRMIESQRAFEAYQKLVSLTMNEVNRRAVNDLAG